MCDARIILIKNASNNIKQISVTAFNWFVFQASFQFIATNWRKNFTTKTAIASQTYTKHLSVSINMRA